jgi:hypothetical protein
MPAATQTIPLEALCSRRGHLQQSSLPYHFKEQQSAVHHTQGTLLFAGGDATFQQVEVDMFRMAALFVVERLKPWLMTYLAALLATAAPAPLLRQLSTKWVPLLQGLSIFLCVSALSPVAFGSLQCSANDDMT